MLIPPPDYLPGADRKTIGLMLALRDTIGAFTQRYPMTAEETIAALCFMAGSAAAQPEAHSMHGTKHLRAVAIDNIDRGVRSVETGNGGALMGTLEGNRLDG